ncbi:MAG: NlpC/P60 family protein [Saccharofermentans sp.]|nr:NlpC/P60 family protein [Saccharofermentans sp.]
MKRKLFLCLLLLISAGTVVSLINFGDAGVDNEVAIQGDVGMFTSADLHPILDGSSQVTYISPIEEDTNLVEKRDEISLKTNTYVLPAYSTTLNDFGDSIMYDGSPMWINVKTANLRAEENVESDILDQLNRGAPVLRVSYTEEWSKIRTEDGTEGYMMTSLLSDEEVEPDPVEEEPVEKENLPADPQPVATPVPTNPTPTQPAPVAPTATPVPAVGETAFTATKYTSCDLNARSGPGVNYSLKTVLSYGTQVSVVAITDNGWYKLSDNSYIKKDYTLDQMPQKEVAPPPADNGYSDFANYALQYVGTAYVYGGASPSGFDCSGFILYLYANYYGISLPHNAHSISQRGTSVTEGIKCGDVLCHDYNGDGYIDHVSMYIGNGTCIHASDSRRGVITSSYPMGSVVTIRRFV